jgi:hypothetical protein
MNFEVPSNRGSDFDRGHFPVFVSTFASKGNIRQQKNGERQSGKGFHVSSSLFRSLISRADVAPPCTPQVRMPLQQKSISQDAKTDGPSLDGT